ncbi:MAG: DUF327 family protein [Spirochaetales bacterium]|nr:DUF327 family protein [Spirochaetales bacterium]
MAGPGPVDPSSPFFSSLASQAALRSGAGKASGSKEKTKTRKFDALLKERLDEASPAEPAVPARFAGLPAEKVLELLMDDVHSSGDILKEKQVPDTILAYKNAVRSFIQYVVDRSFTVTERTSGGNILKRKKFFQVQVIDEKLEQMAAGILSNQKDQLGLLARIEEINGLLVDLLS